MNLSALVLYKRTFFASLLLLINYPIISQWTLQTSNTQYPLHAIYFLNENTGLSVANGNILTEFRGCEIIRTTNGGISWLRVLLDSNLRARSFYFFDENTGFLAGGMYLDEGQLYKTTNGGLNWSNDTFPIPSSSLGNVVFTNNNTGYAGAIKGVFKTTNSGNNWIRILEISLVVPPIAPAKVCFLDENTGFYIWDTMSVYKTINAGFNWQLTTISSNKFLRDIRFLNFSTGFIAGDGGNLFKTTDQGTSWNLQTVPVTQNFYSIFFPNGFTGYVTAEHTVLKTTNSGNLWFTVFGLPADTLFSSFFLNANTGYVCGDDGRIYKTTTGGVLGIPKVSNEIPESFFLYQNYPNPFNPTTNIKFDIAKATDVKISVYDAIGREVETIVNEFISPGIYEVQWYAVKFSSGIYFYKILTNEYTFVKKMSLIK